MNGGIIFLLVFCFLFMGAFYVYIDWSGRRDADKKIGKEPISRDYYNIPGLNKCMRCGHDAYLTTTVDLPAIETKNGKLKYKKFDTRLFYSVRCISCSLCTAQSENLTAVMREWNESEFARIRDRERR